MRVSIRHRAESSPFRQFPLTRPQSSVSPWFWMDQQHDVNNPTNLRT